MNALSPSPVLRWALLAALAWAALSAAPAPAAAPRFLVLDEVLQGTGDTELRWPLSVAAGSSLELAVADAWGARLVIFAADGGVAGGWTAKGAVSLPAPPVAVVHDGRRYVVALRGRSELFTFEGTGTEPGRLPLPEGTVPGALAAAAGGGLLVWDAAAGSVLALDDAGRLGARTPVAGHLTGLAAADGGFYAVIADAAKLRRISPDGRLLAELAVPAASPVPAWPDGLVVEPAGDLLLADRHAGRVIALDGAGRLIGVAAGKGWEPGRLLFPAGMTRLPDGRLAVADRGNGRIQIFRHVAPSGAGPGAVQ